MRLVTRSRKAQRREATCLRILEAALAAFSVCGPEAPIDVVCQAAGCSKGAFYHHFRDRLDLDTALARHLSGGLVRGAMTVGSVAPLLTYLWAEGSRRAEIRRPLRAGIQELAASINGGCSLGEAPEDRATAARLNRLVALGRLNQSELWSTGRGDDSREAYRPGADARSWESAAQVGPRAVSGG